jgi:hypothetical protein
LASNFLVFGYGIFSQETGIAFYQFSNIRQPALDSAFFVSYRDPDFALDSLGGKYLVMVGPNGKIFFSKKDVVSSVREVNLSPTNFSLEQNYPNPFNPTTVIRFQISYSTFVTLRVYDVLGREVALLVNEVKGVGEHEIVFDASGLASGIYFCRLLAGSFHLTRKMVLLQ